MPARDNAQTAFKSRWHFPLPAADAAAKPVSRPTITPTITSPPPAIKRDVEPLMHAGLGRGEHGVGDGRTLPEVRSSTART